MIYSYAGANKMNVLVDKQAVINVILRSIKRERKVKFRLFNKFEEEKGKFQIILECLTKKTLKRAAKSQFEKDGCEVLDCPANWYIVEENQSFKVI